MEFDLVDLIRRHTAQQRDDVLLGIGDDAAVLSVPAGQALVMAVDTLVEGVHFPAGTAAADIGWKALAVNLSDLAAMGASPAWALLTLTLPDANPGFVAGFADGFAALARLHRLALVGGDTTRGPLCISVAVHGFVPPGQALVRAGGLAGDVLLVTGTPGDAAAGLHALQNPARDADPQHRRWHEWVIGRLHRPTPRLAAGIALRGVASACIDISDGLLADLGHICRASGVGAEIEAMRLPRSSALRGLHDDATALRFALGGGDDYELCFSVPPSRLAEVQAALAQIGCSATCIGRLVEGSEVRVRGEDGASLTIDHHGWEHFA